MGGSTYEFQVAADCADPHATEDETTTHNGKLVWKTGQAINHPDGWGPRVLSQVVPEGKR